MAYVAGILSKRLIESSEIVSLAETELMQLDIKDGSGSPNYKYR